MLAGLVLLFLRLSGNPLAPSLAADFDGDGRDETITAAAARGAVGLEVRSADGRVLAEAKAPAPSPPADAKAVHVELAAGPLGSVGTLLQVTATSDASECVSIWRYHADALTRLPIRDAKGQDLPDCGKPGAWTTRWESDGPGRPAAFVRERSEKASQGTLRVKEVFAFAGFSLDADVRRSTREVEGVPIPAWYDAVLYSTPALEILYTRFDLSRMRSEPTLRIVTDRERGVFALRFSDGKEERSAPVDSYAASAGEATLGARLGEKQARVRVTLGGQDRSLPMEVQVEGLGAPFDQVYGPAGSWHGRGYKVFANVSDELASEELVSTWIDPRGGQMPIDIEGAPPYRLRIGSAVYRIELARAEKPVDLLLLPVEPTGQPWGVILRGKNVIERVPFHCPSEDPGKAGSGCTAAGPAERLRRLGARANASG